MATPSRTPSPRGCRGAERPTLASSETKSLKRIAHIVGNKTLKRTAPGRAREGRTLSHPVPEGMYGSGAPHARVVGNKSHQKHSLHRQKQTLQKHNPGRAREGHNPLTPPSPEGM